MKAVLRKKNAYLSRKLRKSKPLSRNLIREEDQSARKWPKHLANTKEYIFLYLGFGINA